MIMGQILENGYELQTTFWRDFSIADLFGESAIEDTFNRAFNEWKTNVKYVTELVMVMSWKSCHHYTNNYSYSILYADLYHKVDNWCLDNLKGEDLEYYLKTTD
jgi:hypothetical protein